MKEAIDKFLAVAQSYTSRGEGRRAISMYRRVIELAPVEMDPRQRLIDLLTSIGHHEEALKEYMEVAEVHYSMADRVKARKAYVDALRIAQQSAVDRSWQVRILHRLADLEGRVRADRTSTLRGRHAGGNARVAQEDRGRSERSPVIDVAAIYEQPDAIDDLGPAVQQEAPVPRTDYASPIIGLGERCDQRQP